MIRQNGNALWFILIAIALLGLLTMSLSKGSNNNDSGDFERNQIVANDILAYAKSMENAVQFLLSRGCSENDISFENTFVSGYTNPNAPTDNSCHVFHVNGAGMTYNTPDTKWLDSSHSAKNEFGDWVIPDDVSVIDLGRNPASEIMLVLPYLKKDICLSANTIIGIDNPSGDAPLDNGFVYTDMKYIGTFKTTDSIGGETASLIGEPTACYIDDGGFYTFYHVLHIR